MSRGGPLSPCPICHSLSALHLPQNLEEEKRGLITLEPGLTVAMAVQLEFSWNFYLRNSSRCNHQALALGIGLKNSTGNDVNYSTFKTLQSRNSSAFIHNYKNQKLAICS